MLLMITTGIHFIFILLTILEMSSSRWQLPYMKYNYVNGTHGHKQIRICWRFCNSNRCLFTKSWFMVSLQHDGPLMAIQRHLQGSTWWHHLIGYNFGLIFMNLFCKGMLPRYIVSNVTLSIIVRLKPLNFLFQPTVPSWKRFGTNYHLTSFFRLFFVELWKLLLLSNRKRDLCNFFFW